MFKKILAPVDLADMPIAQQALATAVRMAEQSGGEVRLLNVRSLMPVTYMEYVPVDFDDKAKKEAERDLETVAAGLALPRDRVTTCVRLGSIYSEVLDEAASWGADLIVVGSHRPSMATYLLGSNATTIVRHAKSAVLVVR